MKVIDIRMLKHKNFNSLKYLLRIKNKYKKKTESRDEAPKKYNPKVQPKSTAQNVYMTLDTCGCDQYMGQPVGVVTGCGQWVVDILFTS